MKKTLVSALTTALVVGAASTTFAAANPFSDVPADHWAYDAVSQLAADGVIEGYGDSTFKGNRNITRYEMAQMVAKAMAKNTSGADKALVDKLAAEFAEELNNLGVRVSKLERNADMVKWNGKIEYTAQKTWAEDTATDDSTNRLKFRLEPSAEMNANWHVKARLDADINAKSDDADGDNKDKVTLKRIWAQGDYDNFQVKVGKFASLNNDSFADREFTGLQLSAGKNLKVIYGVGRMNVDRSNDLGAGARNFTVGNDTATYQYAGVEGNLKKLNAGAYWHGLKGADFLIKRNAGVYSTTDNYNLWALKAGYAFDKNVALNAWYTHNVNADFGTNGWSAEVDYKGAQQENKGTWGAWVAYRHIGATSMIANTYDVSWNGVKGWEIGANYTFLKNLVGTVRYGNGKALDEGYGAGTNPKVQSIFGRLEFFF